MPETQVFPDEVTHLSETITKLHDATSKAEASVNHLDKDYMAAKRYMAEYRGEIDPHEMFQNSLQLKQIDHQGAFAVEVRDKLTKLLDSPYFARIDFRGEAKEEPGVFYIGRFSFTHENELLISDWRSPIASMFYDYDVGTAGYDAPIGRINGDLIRKRQFKIKEGIMEYALESSTNIQDDVLQRELSHTSDEKMKSIIATIQREQNQIIRDERAGTMIIQGVAGSGKTSIALHRVAFLLYRFKERLSARNITILSPNKVFGDYISGVLPELGEEPIHSLSFLDIADIQLEGIIGFEADRDALEANDSKWAERARLKSTTDFVRQMDVYMERMADTIFAATDYTVDRFTAKREWLLSRFAAYKKYPVKQRLRRIADDIHDRFETDNLYGEDVPRPRAILKTLTGMLATKNTLALYKDFYKQSGMPDKLVFPGKKTMEWADVYPFLYFHAAFEGLRESQGIQHLVIDEMQDYTPVQYAVLNLLFKCQKTILGDFGQRVNPNLRHTLEDLKLQYENATVIKLNKSYRSTCEIIEFARRIQPIAGLDVVERHGEEPKVIAYDNEAGELAFIRSQIDVFLRSDSATLGIILKTNSAAKMLFDRLSDDYPLHLISPESETYHNGIVITSIQMAKGLEFDEVLIPGASAVNYDTEYDRDLLYVACTRAMHRLTLTCAGEVTGLIR